MQVRAEVGEEHPPTPAVTQNGRAERQLHAAPSTEPRPFLRRRADPSGEAGQDSDSPAVPVPAPRRCGRHRSGQGRAEAAGPPHEPGGGGGAGPEHPAGPARAEQGGPATRLPAGAAGEPLGQGRTRGRGSGTVLRPERGRRRPSPAHRQERSHLPTATGNGRFPFRFPLPSRPLPHLPPRTVGQAGGTDPAAPLPLPGRAPGPPRSPQRRPAAAHGSARPRSLTIG